VRAVETGLPALPGQVKRQLEDGERRDAERATLPKNVECLTLIELGGSLEAALGDAGRLAADAAAALARTV